ncbi:MAG: AbrB/MazE/SpoVT family DNA-binding domain-containing protein [Alphaproteobacteria bacterium]
MQGRISKWGNSLALRLPKSLAADARLLDGTAVELRVEGRTLVIRPARPKYKLNELLGAHPAGGNEEFDWGNAEGDEEW